MTIIYILGLTLVNTHQKILIPESLTNFFYQLSNKNIAIVVETFRQNVSAAKNSTNDCPKNLGLWQAIANLEHPSLWTGIPDRLITAIANNLAPKLRPKYIVAIEERVYEVSGDTALLVGVPDVSVQSSLSLTRSHPLNL